MKSPNLASLHAKTELRQQVRSAVRGLAPEHRALASGQARARLQAQRPWQEAGTILFYAPLPDEIDIWPLISIALAADKQVFLPRFDPESNRYTARGLKDPEVDLQPGKYGIREPGPHCAQLSLNRLDFVLTPGIAFDLHGRRLGRGRGYYDHILAAVRGITCGVAFDQQIVPEIPVEPHDITVRCILTPSRWIEP
jgi:5-formyltetrahydrofolate cyclo-ligase